jgi:outer membrane murein-binding lipoprotein Lpp
MPNARSTLIAVALVPAALLLGGCGSNDNSKQELTSATASSLQSKLDQVQQAVDGRDCSGAAQEVAALRRQVQGLPSRVDGKLRDALDSSARRLETLVADQCQADTTTTDQPAVGTTSEATPQPKNGKDQTPGQAKDKKPKKQKEPKPGKDEPPPDTGGTTGGATGGSGAVSPGGG